jgi:prepilin-type N-terminal cleavage/methylation domain-containing protein
MRKHFHRNMSHQPAGFTLVELLVVITIIVILLTMTLMTVNFTKEGDRVKGAAKQVQSFLAGARDRAIYSREPRGVRFFVSPENPRAVSTMAYIAPGGVWSSPDNSANISLERYDISGDGDLAEKNLQFPAGSGVLRDESDVFVVRGRQNPGWWNLKRRGWLVDGLRIRIPKGPTGNWYPIDTTMIDVNVAPTSDQILLLQIPYADGGDDGSLVAHSDLSYEIELPAKLLSQDPAILPDSVLIDLDGSRIPDGWRPQNNAGNYSGYMDIVFSPRGNIIGDAAGAGVIHFYVADAEDSLNLKERFESLFAVRPAYSSIAPFIPVDEISTTLWAGGDNNYLTKDRRLVSVFTQTGAVSVHEVNAFVSEGAATSGDAEDPYDYDNDSNVNEPDGLADDPYFYAETGKVAK